MEENVIKFTNCSECHTQEFCIKEGVCSADEYRRANTDWKAHTVSLLGELRNLNYLLENNLVIQILENKTEGKEQVMLKLRKKDSLLYTRTFEGSSDEVKYQLIYFFYMDILNQGLMMMDKLQIEQAKLDKEKSIIENVNENQETKPTGKIIKL